VAHFSVEKPAQFRVKTNSSLYDLGADDSGSSGLVILFVFRIRMPHICQRRF
jgi:hypothetical protein